jgi:acyl-CoA synthetase (NDP forming)
LFNPRVVAVVGASRDPRKWGQRVIAHTCRAGFAGALYGVNPSAGRQDTLFGSRLVRSLEEIGERIDLAVIALPASGTLAAVRDCADAGARAAVLIASGFSELGGEAADAEEQMRLVAAQAGMRLLGPNGFGLYVGASGINLTPRQDIPRGEVALLTQSGNFAVALFGEAARARLGFSVCAGLGNQADVGFGELLGHLAGDPSSRAAAVYIEGIPPPAGQAFRAGLAACRAAGKPVVVLKAGRSAKGATAAATHTASLAADDRVWQAVLDDGGAIRVSSSEEMADVLAAALHLRAAGRRVMVVTDGGGDSVMAADALSEAGLSLALPSAATRATLDGLIPPGAPRVPERNPVTLDTPGGLEDDPLLLARCVRVAGADPAADIVLIAGIFGGYRSARDAELACAEELIAARDAGIPLIVQSAFAASGEAPLERLRDSGIPVYPTVQRLAMALARTTVARGQVGSSSPMQPDSHSPAAADAEHVQAGEDGTLATRSGPTQLLPVAETADLVASYGISLPPLIMVRDASDLEAAVARVTYPACVKLAKADVAHKSDIGGVRLGLPDKAAALEAAAALWQRFPGAPLIVMPMLSPGIEMLVGAAC